MKPLGKLIALVLLMAVVSPALPQASGLTANSRPKAAGCHEHGQKAPGPNPVSYQCCRAGHQFAAVREWVDFRSRLLTFSPVIRIALPALATPVCKGQLVAWSPVFGPPCVTSLRI
jgi:hypothetical protein